MAALNILLSTVTMLDKTAEMIDIDDIGKKKNWFS